MANRINSIVQDLGQVTIELIKATGSCQISLNNNFVLRDVSDSVRGVGEKCANVLSSLNAATTVSGILGDLDTTIMFSTSGIFNADAEIFADHRETF